MNSVPRGFGLAAVGGGTLRIVSSFTGNVLCIRWTCNSPICNVEFASSPGHIRMLPLDPANFRPVMIEPWCGIEIRSLANIRDTLVIRINECNPILDSLSGMIFLNSKNQICLKRMNVEIRVSKLFRSGDNWLNIVH